MEQDDIDLEQLADFLESKEAEFNVIDKDLDEAIQKGEARSLLTKRGPYVRHTHPPPVCASYSGQPHVDPSCASYGPHALCTQGFDGYGHCVCLHFRKK